MKTIATVVSTPMATIQSLENASEKEPAKPDFGVVAGNAGTPLDSSTSAVIILGSSFILGMGAYLFTKSKQTTAIFSIVGLGIGWAVDLPIQKRIRG